MQKNDIGDPPNPPDLVFSNFLQPVVDTYDNLFGVLIKGHLAIEAAIELAAGKKLRKPKAILTERTTFAQKLGLLEALYADDFAPSIYDSCNKLNKIRNHLAHALVPDKLGARLFDFISIDLPSMPGTSRTNFDAMEDKLRAELAMYKLHALLRDIGKTVLADELAIHETEMQIWINRLDAYSKLQSD